MVPESYTGKPVHFISHTWSRKVGDLLKMLHEHLADDGLVWIDIVAINQHPYENRGCLLLEDVASLGKVLAATEDTLFCLDADCVSLRRIWCLYEVRMGRLQDLPAWSLGEPCTTIFYFPTCNLAPFRVWEPC